MENLSCSNCGAPLHENDVFCRRCGAKRQPAVAEYDVGFCPKCGNSLRSGARFCDMCGEDFFAPEQDNARPSGKHRRRRGRGCLHKLILLLLFLGAAGAAATHWDTVRPILEEFTARHFGTPQPDVSRSGEDNAAEVREVTSPVDSRQDSEDSDDRAPEEAETPLVIVVPILEEPSIVPQEEAETPLVIVVPILEEPSIIPQEEAEAPLVIAAPILEEPDDVIPDSAEHSETTELIWSERDRDGYSFLSLRDGSAAGGRILSLRGTVRGINVRVRDRPSTQGLIRRQLSTGDTVDVTGRFASGEEGYYWFQVRGAGEIGWIYGQFLQVESTDSAFEGIP